VFWEGQKLVGKERKEEEQAISYYGHFESRREEN